MKPTANNFRVTRSARLTQGLIALFALGIGSSALATLGEIMADGSAQATTSSTTATPTTKQAIRHAVVRSGAYSVYESELENGTAVKEFADASGRVFAVSWNGPMLPDLQGLLGRHFATFTAGAKQAHRPGSLGAPLNIAQDQVVIRSNGRMRHFFGHAYTPDLVPAGVNVNDLVQ